MTDDENKRRCFEALYDDCARAVLAYALRRTPNRADAADVLSETMLIAWRRLSDVPSGPDALPWLFAVARRVLANESRGARRRVRLGERLRAHLRRSDIAAVDPFVGSDVHAMLERLCDGDREILRLATWEELSGPEIATVLGIDPVTARARLHRARARFKAALQTTDTIAHTC